MSDLLGMAGGQAAGAIMDIGLQGLRNKQQRKQQQRLSEDQLVMDKAKMDYQKQLELDMWKKTSYGAQKEEMIKAGLNPALMYGMGGGGGQTVGGGAAGVSAPNASSQSQGEMMGMMMQAANIELTKAQTEKTKAETVKTSGIDTIEAGTRVKLNQVNADIATIEQNIKSQTQEETIRTIGLGMQQAAQEFDKMVRENSIGQKTYEEQIKQVQANLIQTGLENALLKAEKKLTDRKVYQIAEQIAQGWKGLSIEEQNAVTNRLNAQTNYDNSQTGIDKAQKEGKDQAYYRMINDLTDSDKATRDIIEKIIQAVALRNVMGGDKAGRKEGQPYNQYNYYK